MFAALRQYPILERFEALVDDEKRAYACAYLSHESRERAEKASAEFSAVVDQTAPRYLGQAEPADGALHPDSVRDEQSFVEFPRALEADRRLSSGSQHGWENGTIEDFLEAANAWAADPRFDRTQCLADDVSPWRRLAVFLNAGKIYE